MDGERGAYDVWARMVWAAVDMVTDAGLPTRALFQGLPFDQVSVRRLRRVDWIDYAQLVERIETLAGGPEGCERLMARSYHQSIPELQSLARAFVGPKALLRLVIEFIDPVLFPALEFRYEDLGPNRIRAVFRLRPRARSCEAWFRGTSGAFRGMPQHLGLPPADVVSAEVTPRQGIYEVVLPPSQTIAARLRRLSRDRGAIGTVRVVLGYDERGAPLHAVFGAPEPGTLLAERMQLAARLWSLTPRQIEVLELVARGDANKTIAQTLACAENTVELHVTQLLRKSGASSRAQLVARFWSGL